MLEQSHNWIRSVKVVICGKYKNLNKIIKNYDISLKFHRLLIYLCYSLQFTKYRGMLFKKCLKTEGLKGIFYARKSKEIASLMKMRSTLKFP